MRTTEATPLNARARRAARRHLPVARELSLLRLHARGARTAFAGIQWHRSQLGGSATIYANYLRKAIPLTAAKDNAVVVVVVSLDKLSAERPQNRSPRSMLSHNNNAKCQWQRHAVVAGRVFITVSATSHRKLTLDSIEPATLRTVSAKKDKSVSLLSDPFVAYAIILVN